jgi:hypothetical protein
MDAIAYLQIEFDALRRRYGETMAGITDEQLNWTPPGTANSIGVNLLHCVAGEDLFVQQLIREKPTLWETQNWGEKIGVPVAPGGPVGWEEARQANLNLAAIMEFEEAVCEETLTYLNSLTPEALDRPVSFFGSERPVAFLLAIIIFHSFEHLGEISAIKGVQGIKEPSN